jgi:hypothetical protein
MRRTHARTAAGLTAFAAGVLVALSMRSSGTPTATLAARNPAVEVRTEVIRRTIHIVRHETAHGYALVRGGGSGTAPRALAPAAPRSRTSGSHTGSGSPAGTYVGPPVATRTSGSHAAPTSGAAPAPTPVTTRTSPSHVGSTGTGGAGAPTTVRTRTSGAGSTSGSSSGSPVRTRTSGAGGKHDDGGDGSGSDN